MFGLVEKKESPLTTWSLLPTGFEESLSITYFCPAKPFWGQNMGRRETLKALRYKSLFLVYRNRLNIKCRTHFVRKKTAHRHLFQTLRLLHDGSTWHWYKEEEIIFWTWINYEYAVSHSTIKIMQGPFCFGLDNCWFCLASTYVYALSCLLLICVHGLV